MGRSKARRTYMVYVRVRSCQKDSNVAPPCEVVTVPSQQHRGENRNFYIGFRAPPVKAVLFLHCRVAQLVEQPGLKFLGERNGRRFEPAHGNFHLRDFLCEVSKTCWYGNIDRFFFLNFRLVAKLRDII